MKKTYLLVAIAYAIGLPSGAMDNMPDSGWHLLVPDNVRKIMVWSGLQSQGRLRSTCREISLYSTDQILFYLPFAFRRHEHLYCMVKSAKAENKIIVKSLIDIADNCDHEDVLDWIPLFRKNYTSPSLFLTDQWLSEGKVVRMCDVVDDNLKNQIRRCRQRYVNKVDAYWPLIISFYTKCERLMQRYLGTAVDGKPLDLARVPLVIAARGNGIMLELLLMHDASIINKKFIEGNTMLHVAAGNGHYNIIEILLRYDLCINVGNDDAQAPLMLAAQQGHSDIVLLLLNYGADYRLVDRNNHTAADLATTQEIKDLLLPNI